MQVSERLAANSVRVDVDDSNDTVGKKIRNAEKDWVPYIAVIGSKEQESGHLAVRCRQDGSQSVCSEDELVALIRKEVGAMPYRPLSLPRRLTERPLFWG